MTELKSKDVAGFIRSPDFSKSVFLVYGADDGLVTEHAMSIAAKSGVAINDPFALIRISAEAAASDDTLINEAYMVGMFAGKRVLRVTGAGNDKALVNQIEQLLADPPPDTLIILEAGELKKGMGLRALVEKSATGVAIPCFSDGPQALHGLIDTFFPPSEGKIDRDSRQFLAANLGANRAASRAELEKLSLLAADGLPVTFADVIHLIGDGSATDINTITDCVIAGDLSGFDAAFLKFESAGQNVNSLFFSLIRQFQQLDILRAQMDTERKPASVVIAGARPPVFFARQRLVTQALTIWTGPAIRHAMARLQEALLKARSLRGLDYASTHICLMGLTIAAKRRA